VIRLVRDGDRCRIELVGFLGNTLFGVYRRACEAHGVRARKVDGKWLSTCALVDVPALKAALQAGGVAVEVDAGLAQALTLKAAAIRTDQAEPFFRIASVLESFFTYTVKDGDTLSLIANLFGLTVSEVKGANGRRIQDPNVIVVGQVLIIPEQ